MEAMNKASKLAHDERLANSLSARINMIEHRIAHPHSNETEVLILTRNARALQRRLNKVLRSIAAAKFGGLDEKYGWC